MNLYSPSRKQQSKEWDFARQKKSDAKASVDTQESPETDVCGGNTEAL